MHFFHSQICLSLAVLHSSFPWGVSWHWWLLLLGVFPDSPRQHTQSYYIGNFALFGMAVVISSSYCWASLQAVPGQVVGFIALMTDQMISHFCDQVRLSHSWDLLRFLMIAHTWLLVVPLLWYPFMMTSVAVILPAVAVPKWMCRPSADHQRANQVAANLLDICSPSQLDEVIALQIDAYVNNSNIKDA